MPNFKMQPKGEGLCGTCANAHIAKDMDGRVIIRCLTGSNLFLKAPMVECSEYRHHNEVSLFEMRTIAWTLNTDKTAEKIGFSPPSKRVSGFSPDD